MSDAITRTLPSQLGGVLEFMSHLCRSVGLFMFSKLLIRQKSHKNSEGEDIKHGRLVLLIVVGKPDFGTNHAGRFLSNLRTMNKGKEKLPLPCFFGMQKSGDITLTTDTIATPGKFFS